MGCITKGAKLSTANLKREKYPLPEHGAGAYVWVRALSEKEVREQRKKHGPAVDTDRMESVYDLLALCLVDDAGGQLYADAAEVKEGLDLAFENFVGIGQLCWDLSNPKAGDDEKN